MANKYSNWLRFNAEHRATGYSLVTQFDKMMMGDSADEIDRLTAELAEARNDTDRLDWLEKHREFYANLRLMKAKGSYYEWQIVSDEGVWHGHTIRAAIDAGKDPNNG